TGSPGTGKTHTAIWIGMEGWLAGYKDFFATVPSLINQLKECRSDRTLRSFELKFEKYDLVIIDELGYISFDKEGAELLFTHLSLRAGRKSTIITSNLPFTRWNEIFHDQVLTAALTDRLTHTIIDGISMLGAGSIPTVMLILDMKLAEIRRQKFEYKYINTVTIIRMVISPLVAVVLVSFFPVNDLLKNVFILLAAMPVAV